MKRHVIAMYTPQMSYKQRATTSAQASKQRAFHVADRSNRFLAQISWIALDEIPPCTLEDDGSPGEASIVGRAWAAFRLSDSRQVRRGRRYEFRASGPCSSNTCSNFCACKKHILSVVGRCFFGHEWCQRDVEIPLALIVQQITVCRQNP